MKKFFIFILFLFLIFPALSSATDFYVANGGSGSACTEGSPCALSYANTNANSGDTVHLMDTGGNYTGNQQVAPTDDGITYQKYTGDTPTITGNSSAIPINIAGRNNITVDGITATNSTNGSASWVNISGGDNNIIQNCTFSNNGISSGAWRGILIEGNSEYNYILNNTITVTNSTKPNDTIQIRPDNPAAETLRYVVVKGNVINGHGSHACIDIEKGVQYFAVVDNTFDADGLNSALAVYGDDTQGAAWVNDYGLVEGNIAKNSGSSANDLQLAGNYLITRYNISIDGGRGINFGSDQADNCSVYNNTFHNNSQYNWLTNSTHSFDNLICRNNVFVDGGATFYWLMNPDSTGLNFEYNNFHGAGSITYEGTSTLASIESGYPTIWSNNEAYEPGFVGEANDNFELDSGSSLVDAGTHLTQADGSGSASQTLIVDSAQAFQDGLGMTASGEISADYIAIGTVDNTVQISSINYATKTITLASNMTWSDNANIWLYKDSQGDIVLRGSAPDMGAYEYDASTTAALTGTLADGATEAQIVAGGQVLTVTLTSDTFVATFGDDNQITTDFIVGLDSGGAEAAGWDVEVKGNLVFGDVARTNNTTATVTLQAEASFAITQNETITLAIPASSLTESDSPVVATPTFEITATLDPAAALTGTLADNATEAQIVAGGETLIISLTNDTWVAAGATFDAARQAIIDGMDSAQSEATGWNAEVRDKEVVTAVVRTNATTVTITLTAQAAYDISANESITMTVPASALVTSGDAVVATPGFAIIFFDTSGEEVVGMTLQ